MCHVVVDSGHRTTGGDALGANIFRQRTRTANLDMGTLRTKQIKDGLFLK